MKKIWIGAGLLAAACLLGKAQGHEARLAQLDVLDYQFDLTISDSTDRIDGLAAVTLELKQPSQRLTLDLVAADGDGPGMHVSAVTGDPGQKITFEHRGEALAIDLGANMPAGTRLTLKIAYHGVPADGLIISNDKEDGRSFFGDNWPNRAHHWLPTVDHPSDKATVGFAVTAPAHYAVVANGNWEAQTALPNGMQLAKWRCGEPIPTKVMVFGAADFAIQQVGDMDGIPVSSWVFAKDEEAGFRDYKQGLEILRFMTTLVEDYPWSKLANVQSRTRYGGMENASCIFYAESSVKGDGSCEALMAHEIAHQWFGNSASEANWYHIWLSEGFATYLTHLYFEIHHDIDIARRRLAQDRTTLRNWPQVWRHAVVDSTIADLNDLLSPNSYEKGSWVLHMLRNEVGNEVFFSALTEYYRRFRFGNALTSDFRAVMEELSGKDLAQFFDQWLYRPGMPKLDVVWSYKKGKGMFSGTITQQQAGKPYVFALDIDCLDAEGKRLGGGTVQVASTSTKFQFSLPQAPAKVVLDPSVHLLFEGKARAK